VSGPVADFPGVSVSMNVLNSKKPAPTALDFQWAGTVARIRRGHVSSRSGRRSALLGILTSAYANSSRGTRPGAAADARPGTPTDRS